ncbi:MAG: hypothetical protein JRM82_03780 [Nitrososphaerota archaeon]|nr:hypothetical protein [Nitrososphaerota archaeon]
MKAKNAESERKTTAPLYFVCPYDKRRRFKSIRALNIHIRLAHNGEPPVRAKVVRLPLGGSDSPHSSRLEVILVRA